MTHQLINGRDFETLDKAAGYPRLPGLFMASPKTGNCWKPGRNLDRVASTKMANSRWAFNKRTTRFPGGVRTVFKRIGAHRSILLAKIKDPWLGQPSESHSTNRRCAKSHQTQAGHPDKKQHDVCLQEWTISGAIFESQGLPRSSRPWTPASAGWGTRTDCDCLHSRSSEPWHLHGLVIGILNWASCDLEWEP